MLPLTSMTGQLITEMMAKETDERRVNFEPFNSLILPLPEARDIFVRVRVHLPVQVHVHARVLVRVRARACLQCAR